uniref:hypothetical protein n=1 Tax=Pappia fissilis TaxID=1040649 RepID=UPI002A819371|nr:hypothetical protein UYP79_mgp001 [Pappia fissilis]WOX61243.1 hypothetical protein [Pappia fissilis]
MIFISLLIIIVAIALPSINKHISPVLFTRISSIVFIYAASLLFNIEVYIQSIGSGIGIYSGLFHITVVSQLMETFIYLVGSFILMMTLYINHLFTSQNIMNISKIIFIFIFILSIIITYNNPIHLLLIIFIFFIILAIKQLKMFKIKNKINLSYSFSLTFILSNLDIDVTNSDIALQAFYGVFLLSLIAFVCFINIIGYIIVYIYIDKMNYEIKYPKLIRYINYYKKSSLVYIAIDVFFCFICLLLLVIFSLLIVYSGINNT